MTLKPNVLFLPLLSHIWNKHQSVTAGSLNQTSPPSEREDSELYTCSGKKNHCCPFLKQTLSITVLLNRPVPKTLTELGYILDSALAPPAFPLLLWQHFPQPFTTVCCARRRLTRCRCGNLLCVVRNRKSLQRELLGVEERRGGKQCPDGLLKQQVLPWLAGVAGAFCSWRKRKVQKLFYCRSSANRDFK